MQAYALVKSSSADMIISANHLHSVCWPSPRVVGLFSLFVSSLSKKEGVTIERRRVRPLLRPQKHSKVNKNPFRRTTSTPEEPSTTNSRWCPGSYPAVMPCHQNLDICIGERQEVHTNSTGPSSPFPMSNEGDSRHAKVFHSSVGSPSLSVGSGHL